MEKLTEVTYVSVWDGGFEIRSKAKIDEQTGLLMEIEVVEGIDEEGDEVQVLDEEYLEMPNGEKLYITHGDNGPSIYPF
ncbi:hypothetical protein [Psychrobacillus sp. FSL K6-1464]|uniref:hypothetical protein n=1 Tax=Psychrobacillus sp. FSL K6-1464 TaxID=2921545 RepID=UPI0030F4D3BC